MPSHMRIIKRKTRLLRLAIRSRTPYNSKRYKTTRKVRRILLIRELMQTKRKTKGILKRPVSRRSYLASPRQRSNLRRKSALLHQIIAR